MGYLSISLCLLEVLSFFTLFSLNFLRFIYLFESQSYTERGEADRERETEREVFHPMVHSPIGRNGRSCTDLNQELLPGLPRGFRGPRTWAIFHCLHRPLQRTVLEVEQLGLELAPIWDAGTAGGGFTCYATVRAPPLIFIQPGIPP